MMEPPNRGMLFFFTKNPLKAKAAAANFACHRLDIEPCWTDIPDRGSELREVVIQKVLHAHEKLDIALFAKESAFYVHAFSPNGQPYESGRLDKAGKSRHRGYPGCHVDSLLEGPGIEGLLDMLRGALRRKPSANRGCELRSAVGYMARFLLQPVYFGSRIGGRVAHEPRGELRDGHWSQLDLIIIPELSLMDQRGLRAEDQEVYRSSTGKTLAEMTDKEYELWRRIIDRPEHELAYYVGRDQFRLPAKQRGLPKDFVPGVTVLDYHDGEPRKH